MKHIVSSVTQTPYLEKFLFLSYGPEWSYAIRLQDSLSCNIWRRRWLIMEFFVCSQISMAAKNWSCQFGYYTCLGMPKEFWNNKLSISLKRVEWLSWFFAHSHTSVEDTNYAIFVGCLIMLKVLWITNY